MFKALIGKDHPEFSTKRQQDAQEFLLHIINTIEVRTRMRILRTQNNIATAQAFFFNA